MEIIVCKYFQLARFTGNKFSQEHKTLIRDKAKIPRSHFENINASWQTSGKWYEIDEVATADFKKYSKEKYDARLEADNLRVEGGRQLAEAITNIAIKNPVGRPKTK